MRRLKGLECNFTGELCYNPRCKVGLCVKERMNAATAHRKMVKPLDREVAKVAKQVAREMARRRGKVPTPALLAKAINNPRVLEEANAVVSASLRQARHLLQP
jgi:hypothetical protein